MKPNVIVIGAGLGGLAISSLLASKGYSVTVFEKNATPGGKMQELWIKGYRFDTGPSLFTLPFILEKLFEKCGEKFSESIHLSELEPICRYFYPDGVIFDCFSDREKTRVQIRKFAETDADAYTGFLDHSKELYHRTSAAFLFNPLYDISDFKGLKLSDFRGIDAFSTVSDKVDEFFQSPYLRKFFKRFTTYNGSSPYQAPATLNVIPHVELNRGGYYVQGGMYRIAESLYRLAENMGVVFRFNTPVKSIHTEKREVRSVTLADGRKVDADLVVANSDATDTILNLMEQESVSKFRKKRQKAIEPSCSGFVTMLGAEKKWEQLKHHNIFFSDNYRKEFDQIFRDQTLPDDPTIYIANTSYTESSHAPRGCSNLFVMVNAPHVAEHQNWVELRKHYSSFLIEELERRGLDGLKNSITCSEVITPDTFLNRYGSNRGSIYGTSSNSLFSAFLRPGNKLRGYKNIYMVGGSTHPGGGIPLVIQSAFNASDLIERYHND